LAPKRANSLVKIFSSMQLVRKAAKDAELKLDSIPWQWIEEDEEEDLVEEEEAGGSL
jgi:hypothetical protein